MTFDKLPSPCVLDVHGPRPRARLYIMGRRVRWYERGVARPETKDKSLESLSMVFSVSAMSSEFVKDLLCRAYLMLHDDEDIVFGQRCGQPC